MVTCTRNYFAEVVATDSRCNSWEMIGGEEGETLSVERMILVMKRKKKEKVVARTGKEPQQEFCFVF